MRLMHFIVECPWPTISGADIRNTLLCDLPGVTAYRCIGLTQPQSLHSCRSVEYHRLASFASENPWRCYDPAQPTCLRFSEAAIREVDQLLNEFRPTVAVLEGVAWRDMIRQIKDRRITTVLDMHNIESQLYEERIQSKPWHKKWESYWFGSRRSSAVRETDRELSCLADQTWICSEQDQARLQSLAGKSHHIVPNPIPDESLLTAPIAEVRYRNPTPLFIGHLSYFPNVDAVLEIATHLPIHMASRKLSVQPIVAGRSPNKVIRRLATKGSIQLIANPASCAELLSKSGYTLLPIRSGSGTRLKALEALAAGVVMIATEKAVEGLGLLDGVHYCRAESISAMSQRLSELLDTPRDAMELAERGRQFVSQNYRRSVVQEKILKALASFDP